MHHLPPGAHRPAALDPVPGVRVQMAQPQPFGYRVGAGLYLDKAHEHGFLVLTLEHPGILIAAVQPFEPVQVSKLDQRTDLFIKSDFLCQSSLLRPVHPHQIQLQAQVSPHCYGGPRLQRFPSGYLVVGRLRDMALHSGGRIQQRYPVLNGQPLHGVSVVAGPHLGHIVQDAGVKPSAAPCAAFEKDVGELLRQGIQHVIQAQDIAVRLLLLTLRRQIGGA